MHICKCTYYSLRHCNFEPAMEFKTHKLLTALVPVELAKVIASDCLQFKIASLMESHRSGSSRL